MSRVISLIASSTEIVCALGYENQLVGRSHECDFPLSVKNLPTCTEPKFDVNGSSAEIDERVKETLKNALSVYDVDSEKLEKLQPSVIITQSQCEVCAVSLKDVERAVSQLTNTDAKVVSLEPNQLSDVWLDIKNVAQALDATSQGDALVASLQQRMTDIVEKTQSIANKPTVGCIEWIDPLMSAGNWVPELVEMGGGIDLLGKAGAHSPWLTWEQLQQADPDILLVMPCGFDIKRNAEEMPALTNDPRWTQLKAVRNQQVYLTDGNQYFNRPGPRLVESLEIIAEILHPDLFQFNHHSTGWVILENKH